jgi:hypothetical protein
LEILGAVLLPLGITEIQLGIRHIYADTHTDLMPAMPAIEQILFSRLGILRHGYGFKAGNA